MLSLGKLRHPSEQLLLKKPSHRINSEQLSWTQTSQTPRVPPWPPPPFLQGPELAAGCRTGAGDAPRSSPQGLGTALPTSLHSPIPQTQPQAAASPTAPPSQRNQTGPMAAPNPLRAASVPRKRRRKLQMKADKSSASLCGSAGRRARFLPQCC